MAKITLVFTDFPGKANCFTHVEGDPEASVDVMDKKLHELGPAQQCLYLCIEALKKMKKINTIQEDLESMYSKDPGFIPNNNSAYH